MSTHKTCYMCDNVATSREHAPPQSFFPADRRKNLITVPSCDEHNSRKSKDDEYLGFVIAVSYDTNEQGHKVILRKALRGLKERPYLLREFVFSGKQFPITIEGLPSMAFTINYPRFETALDHMARAIFYHHFREKWIENLHVLPLSGGFSPDQPNSRRQNARLLHLKNTPFRTRRHGANQDIFYYQVLTEEPPSGNILKMVFYGGFTVIAYPMSRTTAPSG